ncbi:MAG TPA: bifunctional phosphopantothenoylcysteine decarboxylase/phosphopantothenate--cysteine ligase CoaBC [Armatimonadota bacterium]|nr:bifunctional phosphopantothenoylcysteine decarboxylase/phosphopantothenate--cysteine ligase CoaBC [Armatimonadota bacterium]HQK92447.1 bifunctional phosphopantothenoylcysteine decarboxylase/phosphopantothenate--cysteine ligase CoaBC [Armatimonadota bacterium]
MSHLEGRSVLVGITGGIACYKAAELVRSLRKAQAQVRVMMTRAACEFVTPLTFQTLSQKPVATDLFAPVSDWEIEHISLARGADVVVVAPATANVIGKVAHGIADDLVTTVIMATRAPVVFCPAMNVAMWENPIVQANIRRLAELGYRFVEPAEGDLACGEEGKGRLAEVERIVEAVAVALP